MRRPLPSLAAAALATLLALTACGNTPTPARPANPSTGAVSASNAPRPPTHNDADTTFAQQMIPHHQQAIQMSDTILAKTGVDPRVLQLANQIKAAQDPEIQTMQTWLRQWGQPTAPAGMTPGSAMPAMPDHSGMGGMMSEQDMQALQNAAGLAAAKLFLAQMIQHHRGAVDAAQTEIASGIYGPAVTLARSIVSTQQQEIATMQSLGAAL